MLHSVNNGKDARNVRQISMRNFFYLRLLSLTQNGSSYLSNIYPLLHTFIALLKDLKKQVQMNETMYLSVVGIVASLFPCVKRWEENPNRFLFSLALDLRTFCVNPYNTIFRDLMSHLLSVCLTLFV